MALSYDFVKVTNDLEASHLPSLLEKAAPKRD